MALMKTVRLAWEEEKEAKEAEVIEEVESFLVEADSGGQWLKTFDSAERPGMLRVTLTAPVGRKAVTLTETARPMAGAVL
jgi:ATP phosphoribosyltransferase regulatory subunit HisZ